MAKNSSFHRMYTIEVKGITTNGHAEKFIDSALFAVVQALDSQFKQVSVKTIPQGESHE